MHVQPLKGVVQHQHVGSLRQGPLCPGRAVRVGHHLGVWEGLLVHQRLVPTIASQQDSGDEALGQVVAGNPHGYGGLAGAADGQIPYRDRRQRQITYRCPAPTVDNDPERHGTAPET